MPQSEGTEASATVTPAAPATAAPPVQAAPATEPQGEANPPWLKDRLVREQRALLKQLGCENIEDVATSLAELKRRKDSEKSERQVLDEAMAQLKSQVAAIPAMQSALEKHADAEMAKLTDGQRSAVLAIAPSDKAQQLSVIVALRPTWSVLAGIGATPAQPNLATVPAPANTSPASPAPAPAQPGQPIDWLALYKSHAAAGRSHLSARILVDHPEIAPDIRKA